MNPLYFGRQRRPLFGVYQPPSGRPLRRSGVVLCAPFGLEYMRTYKMLHGLAGALARDGHHVFRFDWYGTGDSGGDGLEADLQGWLDDLDAAVEELRAISGVTHVSLAGTRLGGSVALLFLAGRSDVEALVLWDPVVRGAQYLTDLLCHARPLPHVADATDPMDVEVQGYALSARFGREIAALDLSSSAAGGIDRLGLFLSDPEPATTQVEFHARQAGVDVKLSESHDPGIWSEPRRLGKAVLAPRLASEVVAWLS